MKVLVTGATGTIGNEVVIEALSRGYEVTASGRRSEEEVKGYVWYGKAKYIQADIFERKENFYEFFGKPDLLIHLSWDNVRKINSLDHLEITLPNQFYFLKNMIINGLKNFTVAGTCFEYGLANGELKENIDTRPCTSYGIAKDSLRKFIEEMNKTIDFNYKWARIFYVYGGKDSGSLISLVNASSREGVKIFNMSGGEQLRDYSEVKDLAVNLVKIAMQSKFTGPINCCSGLPVSVRRFVEEYMIKNNIYMDLCLGFYPYPKHEPMAFWGNTEILKNIKSSITKS